MIIDIKWSWQLKRQISGVCVVLDINAATTNLALILSKGVNKLIIANEKNVFSLKKKYKDAFVIGESNTLPEELFNCSNLPSDIVKQKLAQRGVLYMSNNGSKVIEKNFRLGCKKIVNSFYCPYMKNIQKNLEIEFSLNRYSLIPVCQYNFNQEIIVSKRN